MKKKPFYLLILCSLFQSTFSQPPIVNTFLNFTGSIDKYPIEMTLKIKQKSASISGEYYYVKNPPKETIFLEGTIKNDSLHLRESIYDNRLKEGRITTGKFTLKNNSYKKVSGDWLNQKNNKNLKVYLSSKEHTLDNNPMTYSYEVQYSKDTVQKYNHLIKINGLKIYNENKKLLQLLDGFDEFIFGETAEIELEDINFDGYLDLKIPIYFPERSKYDSSYLYYLYDCESKKFQLNPQLNDLEYLTFDSRTKEAKAMFADGHGNEETKFYKWQNGVLYLIREEKEFEKEKSYILEYKIVKGQSVAYKKYKK